MEFPRRGNNTGEEDHDPVAVKTKLGWVLSGPLKGKTEVGTVKVNLNVSRCVPHSVEALS